MASRKETRTRPRSSATSSQPRRPRKTSNVAKASETSARSTVSGPTRKAGAPAARDAAMAKVAGVETLATAFPYNAAKPSEFGAAAREPTKGQAVEPADPMIGGSTLSETNASPKVGSGNPQAELQPLQRAARSRPCRFQRTAH